MAADNVAIEYTEEARRQMEEVSFALKMWRPHEDRPSTTERAFVDLTTLEGRDYTVQLDRSGFQVELAACTYMRTICALEWIGCPYNLRWDAHGVWCVVVWCVEWTGMKVSKSDWGYL